ncbi:MAG: outer membrane beta-barrel protein [Bacteroidales bacterium]|nr:outer membrane beta-barrel protein [Bacteroidales bacterium]MBN2817626.1 outer membrane beta-barrel protein [Bacteroidales bacterium]
MNINKIKLLIITIAFGMFANAQDVCFNIGYGIANYLTNSSVETQYIASPKLGFGYKHNIVGKHWLGANLSYIRRGTILIQENQFLFSETEMKLNYLQFAPNYTIYFLNRLELNVGFSCDIYLNGNYNEQYTYDGGQGSRKGDIDYYKRLGLSLNTRIGYHIEVSDNLFINPGLHFSQGVSPINEVKSTYDYYNQNIIISVAIIKSY